MNKIYFLVSALSMCCFAMDRFGEFPHYIDRFLPRESLIRYKNNSESSSFCCFKSKIRKQCDYIEQVFQELDEKGQRQYWVHDPYDMPKLVNTPVDTADLKAAIKIILSDQTDEIKLREYQWVQDAITAINDMRKERLSQQKKKQQRIVPKFE